MLELAGINIPISNREQYQLPRGRLPVRLGSPVDEGAARNAWIQYSVPLWREAGRSEAWIIANIVDEWARAKDDIIRRYLAGDFGAPPPIPVRTIACPQCKSTLQIIPPSPDLSVTQAFEWLTCPVCGYPELVQVPTGGFTVKIMVRKPWPPVAEPLPPEIEMRVFITPSPEATQIHDALIQYEKKIEELENALRTAQAAEFYNNPYGTIEAQAVKILGQLEQIRIPTFALIAIYPPPPPPAWFVHMTNHLNNLKNRVKTLIINSRTAAKERKPIPTYSEEVGAQQDEWITDTIGQLLKQGLSWSSLPFSYLQPGQTGINGRAILPTEEGIPPTWKTYTEFPVGIPDYSVEQRMQEASGQEPWELAEALPAAPPKKITPYLILAGLGVTTLGVWYYKKKKKRAR